MRIANNIGAVVAALTLACPVSGQPRSAAVFDPDAIICTAVSCLDEMNNGRAAKFQLTQSQVGLSGVLEISISHRMMCGRLTAHGGVLCKFLPAQLDVQLSVGTVDATGNEYIETVELMTAILFGRRIQKNAAFADTADAALASIFLTNNPAATEEREFGPSKIFSTQERQQFESLKKPAKKLVAACNAGPV